MYNSKVIDQYTFTHAEQYSIALYNLIQSYNIPREFYRSVVNIVNSIIRDGDKLGRSTFTLFFFFFTYLMNALSIGNQTIMMPDAVKNLLYKTSPIVGHQYDICRNGCKLFKHGDNDDDKCTFCKQGRYMDAAKTVPVEKMKMISVGDYLAAMLAKDDVRETLRYRVDRESEAGVYTDVFDGNVYKKHRQEGKFEGDLDVAMALFVDGFTHQKKGKTTKTIVHALIYNVDPSMR